MKGPKLENHRKFCYNCGAVGHFGHVSILCIWFQPELLIIHDFYFSSVKMLTCKLNEGEEHVNMFNQLEHGFYDLTFSTGRK